MSHVISLDGHKKRLKRVLKEMWIAGESLCFEVNKNNNNNKIDGDLTCKSFQLSSDAMTGLSPFTLPSPTIHLAGLHYERL